MALQAPTPQLDRYVVIHVATTCDEHGVYVTRDTAEVIELGWILLDTKTCEEVAWSLFETPRVDPVSSFTRRSIVHLANLEKNKKPHFVFALSVYIASS